MDAQLLERVLLVRVAGRDGNALDLAVVDDVDDAPVRDLGHRETSQRREGVVEVERRRQDGPGLGEEANLPLVLERLSVEAGVVDGHRGAASELERAREIGLRVPAAGLGRDEGDRADRPAARNQRHGHRRAEAELADRLEQVRLVRERLDEHLVGDLGIELRLLRPDHVRHALRRVGIRRRHRCGQLLGKPNLGRVGVRGGEPLNRPVVGDHVDRAPVGERRDDELRDVRQRHLVVEGRAEQLACLRDEPPLLGELRLLLVDRRRADARGGEVRDGAHGRELLLGERASVSVVEDERPDYLALMVEGHREEGLVALRGVCLLVRGSEPLRRGDVAGDDRAVERDLGVVALDRGLRGGDVPVGEPRDSLEEPLVARAPAPERVAVGRERLLRQVEHLGQDLVQVQGGQKPACGFDK